MRKSPSRERRLLIICLPKSYQINGSIKIPRGQKSREFLARNGLIGKISLSSNMNEEEIMTEISSVFAAKMGSDSNFPFTILQPAGGASRSLVIPSLSASFKWSASTVAGKNAKVPIYILAGADLKVILSTFLCNRSWCLCVMTYSSIT